MATILAIDDSISMRSLIVQWKASQWFVVVTQTMNAVR